nr:MAG TPA: hypothetical protein [Caudoviricetes sp.]
MLLGRACSRSICTTRARTPMLMLVSAPLHPRRQILKAYGLCFSAGGIKGFAPLLKLGNLKLGIGRRFLFAAAAGIMMLGRACSRSISTTRARYLMLTLVSAPLYPRGQICRAYGLCVSAEGIKGPISMLSK